MKFYLAIILQLLIWSGYTLIEWLSKHDQLVFKAIMFFVFFYLAFLLGRKITRSAPKALFVTALSLTMYTSFHFTMAVFFHL